jgi:hypothetical protein
LSHNVHHIVCNSVEHDPDIQHMPLLACSNVILNDAVDPAATSSTPLSAASVKGQVTPSSIRDLPVATHPTASASSPSSSPPLVPAPITIPKVSLMPTQTDATSTLTRRHSPHGSNGNSTATTISPVVATTDVTITPFSPASASSVLPHAVTPVPAASCQCSSCTRCKASSLSSALATALPSEDSTSTSTSTMSSPPERPAVSGSGFWKWRPLYFSSFHNRWIGIDTLTRIVLSFQHIGTCRACGRVGRSIDRSASLMVCAVASIGLNDVLQFCVGGVVLVFAQYPSTCQLSLSVCLSVCLSARVSVCLSFSLSLLSLRHSFLPFDGRGPIQLVRAVLVVADYPQG